ncbi:unnamed protein product [Symbiodinium natans]|uniref:Uncharacterized protein n=1 Tax=Symbiodinium natans TaxID=878477 RepID=A0A812UW11_9DINO|nr:unnamed protein product [Symbiodinium natans]
MVQHHRQRCGAAWQEMTGGASNLEPDPSQQYSFEEMLQQELDEERQAEDDERQVVESVPDAQLQVAIPSALTPEAMAAAKRRRLQPGASTTAAAFQSFFDSATSAYQTSLRNWPETQAPSGSGNIKQQTQRILQLVRQERQHWSEEMIRMAAAAITVYRTRYTDIFVHDFVGLIWIIEGERFLRAHRGVCYLYHDSGAFEAFNGVPPESTFHRLKNFLLKLEGMFRLMSVDVQRSDSGVLREMSRLRAEYNSDEEFMNVCKDEAIMTLPGRPGSARRRQGGEADAAGWPTWTADMLGKFIGPLQKDLLEERRLLQFLAQWCDTPPTRTAGCAFDDVSLLYDLSADEHEEESDRKQSALSSLLQQESEENSACPKDALSQANKLVVEYALGFGPGKPEPVRKTSYTTAWWKRWATSKLGLDKKIWQDLLEKEWLLPMEKKANPDVFIPVIPLKKQLADILDYKYSEETTLLEEHLNARALWDALELHPSRAANAELLRHFFTKVLGKVQGKRGRNSLTQDQYILFWKSRAEKLSKHEECASSLLDFLQGRISERTEAQGVAPAASSVSPLRRQRGKKRILPSEPSSPVPADEGLSGGHGSSGNPFPESHPSVSKTTSYHYKLDGVRSRRYGESRSVQHLGTAWQAAVLADTVDLDIENSCFSLILQLLDKLEPQHDSWPGVRQTLDACANRRAEVIQSKLQKDKSTGKSLLQKIFNGGAPPAELAENVFVQDLQRASLFCRWAAATALKDIMWASVLNFKERPDLSILTYFWNIAEDVVLDAWLAKARTLNSKHLSLHFDGLRIDRSVVLPDPETFCRDCEMLISKETDFKVRIRPKEHENFMSMLRRVENKEEVVFPEVLAKPGNCILAALHHLGEPEKAMRMASTLEGPDHTYFLRRQCRTYQQVSAHLDLDLYARFPSQRLAIGQKFFIHLATGGRPHCVAGELLSAESVRITDGAERFSMSMQDFSRMCSEATDRKYILFIFLGHKPESSPLDADEDEYTLLLETQAGAAGGDYDEVPDAFVRDVELPFSSSDNPEHEDNQEDEGITHVADRLLDALEEEVNSFLSKDSSSRALVIQKAEVSACPFCPSRTWERNRPGRVVAHIQKHHTRSKQFVASGTKQLKVVIALHDQDQCERRKAGNYLARSAALLSAHLDDSVYALHARLVSHFPGEVSSLIPRHANHWWPMLEDVFQSPRILQLLDTLSKELISHEEYEVVSMDATLRCCLPIMGQAHPRASREVKAQAVFKGEAALTRAS